MRIRSSHLMLAAVALSAAASLSRAAVVAEYKFDEGSGTTATDSSGNGNDATLNGSGVTYTANAAQGPYALAFTGNGYVQTPALSPADASGNFQLEMNVLAPGTKGVSTTNQEGALISDGKSGYPFPPGFTLYVNDYNTNNGKLQFAAGGSGSDSSTSGSLDSNISIADGTYHDVKVVVTGDVAPTGSQTIKDIKPQVTLYVDGTNVGSAAFPSYFPVNSQAYYLGENASKEFGFTGNLDDVRITSGTGAAVPEPASLGLLGAGALGLLARRRRA